MELYSGDLQIEELYKAIVMRLAVLGESSRYASDADEPDPLYRSYGVRAPETKQLISDFRKDFSGLTTEQKIALAESLIRSGYGEQKTVALALLDKAVDHFTPDRFDYLEQLVRELRGWSKVDAYTGSFLRFVLEAHEAEFLNLLASWNKDQDLWLRRTSVVIFTRKVARSGRYKEEALVNCNALMDDPEHLVQTGVGWCLRDLMRWHKPEILELVIDLRKRGVSSKITLYALRDIKGEERKAILAQT